MSTSIDDLCVEGLADATLQRNGMESGLVEDQNNATTDDSGRPSADPVDGADREPATSPDVANKMQAPEATKNARVCGICNEGVGKYKCARCALPFCSVACSKIHKENHPPDPEPAVEPAVIKQSTTRPSDNANVHGDAKHPFHVLDDCQQLKYLFRRYPDLPNQLLAISAATEPPSDAGQPKSLKEALLAKASGTGRPKKEQWNHDVGIRNGKEALRKARRAHGEDGEGVREFSELIVHLLSRNDEVSDGAALLRDQAAEADVKLIRSLLDQESSRHNDA